MRPIVRVAIAACAALLLGAAPAPRFGPAPKNAQYAAVQRYVDALRAARYDDAYALLTDAERRYFGDASAYRSVFDADGYALQSASIVGARGDERGRVFFVREKISYVDHATDKRRVLDATVPLGVLAEGGRQHVKDPGKPYRAFAPAATAEASGLRVTVKKVDFFPDRVDVVLTFANIGDGFVTVLPYNKSVLRDDRGGVYRVLALKDWTVTDKRLFEGIPLAPSSQYTGAMAFVAQRFGDVKRRWSLTVAPALRDGADAPFEVTITIPPPG